jgi:hypothetical protein
MERKRGRDEGREGEEDGGAKEKLTRAFMTSILLLSTLRKTLELG